MDKDELTLYTEEMKRYLWFKSGLDTTRNLAVMILFGMIFVSFGFSEPTSHRVPYFGSLAVFALVLFETRLFRFYAASETRIRLMERHMIGPLFDKGIKGTSNGGKRWRRHIPGRRCPASLKPSHSAYTRITLSYFSPSIRAGSRSCISRLNRPKTSRNSFTGSISGYCPDGRRWRLWGVLDTLHPGRFLDPEEEITA